MGRKDLAPSWENNDQHRKGENDPECQANGRVSQRSCHSHHIPQLGAQGLVVDARGALQSPASLALSPREQE